MNKSKAKIKKMAKMASKSTKNDAQLPYVVQEKHKRWFTQQEYKRKQQGN